MATVNFRKIDVDALDPENQIEDLVPPQEPVSVDQIQTLSQQVKQILGKGDYVSALKYALDNPPYGGDENVKVGPVKEVRCSQPQVALTRTFILKL
jgi:actin related protein 2/3 complex, subunit 5